MVLMDSYRLAIIVACLALSNCVGGDLAIESQIKKYSGDGTIYNCSIPFAPGYRIEFPTFDAASPYEDLYRLSGVPSTNSDHAVIYLRFFNADLSRTRKKKKSVTASFRIALCDSTGSILHSAEFQVSESGWMEERGLFGVYDLGKSYLHFKRGASYV